MSSLGNTSFPAAKDKGTLRTYELNDNWVMGDKVFMTEVAPSSPSRFWRNKKQYLGLVGEICPHCDFAIFPPRDLCPSCGPKGQVTLDMLVEAQTREESENAARLALAITEPEFVG